MMQALFLLVCFVALVHAREDIEENPHRYSKHLDALAKEINSRDDVLWIAHDPEMSELEYQHRLTHIENKIATMSADELQALLPDRHFETLTNNWQPQANAASKDWTPYVRTPEDQGQCGSCWAFSTVHAFNDYINIKNGANTAPKLSIQEVLTCCTGEGCGGCNGGYLVASYNYMARYGTPSSSCKPYDQFPKRCVSTCDDRSPESNQEHFFPTDYTQFTGRGMDAIMTALQVAPASGSMMVYEDFMKYNGGIYHHVSGGNQGGHAIEIVGYGTQGSTPYWIVKNSWSTRWGSNGFFRILRGTNECNFEAMERGYNYGTGYRSQVKNFRQPKFTTLDEGDPQMIDEDEPAGDEVTNVSVDDEKVLEAALHAAAELNPVHCNGNVTLVKILNAEAQIVSGVKYILTIVVNATTCLRGAETFFVQEYMDPMGFYTLSDFYAMGPYIAPEAAQPCVPGGGGTNGAASNVDSEGQVDGMWRTLAGVFIGISAFMLFVSIALGCRIASAPKPVSANGDGGGTYHRLDHEL